MKQTRRCRSSDFHRTVHCIHMFPRGSSMTWCVGVQLDISRYWQLDMHMGPPVDAMVDAQFCDFRPSLEQTRHINDALAPTGRRTSTDRAGLARSYSHTRRLRSLSSRNGVEASPSSLAASVRARHSHTWRCDPRRPTSHHPVYPKSHQTPSIPRPTSQGARADHARSGLDRVKDSVGTCE